MENKYEAARNYLREQEDLNINLLAALQAGLAEVVALEEYGCLLHTSGYCWQIAAEDAEAALRLFGRVPKGARALEVQGEEQAAAVAEQFCPRSAELYHNVWYAQDRMELPKTDWEIRAMEERDADFLARHYHMPGATEKDFPRVRAYLLDRIAAGTMFGVFQEGEIAGFAGNHDEGSIGMLTVLPAFRRRGLGLYLEQIAISRALARGEIPFGQVAPDNAASLALQRRLGMQVSEGLVCWMEQ